MRKLCLVILLLIHLSGNSQSKYPQGYFRNPLDIPISLSGNFGELRSNHYHMGIDLKTNQRENLSVFAAAEGYVSRIKIEPGGFGRAIYITHPNGYTTLYAHLNKFATQLEGFVKEQQYKLESWRLDLEIPPRKFPVKRGEFIAFSGNTGGSQAPHLHFEIRRTADEVNVNPLLFGLPYKDDVHPRILRLAVYDRTISLYEQKPRVYPVKAVSPSSYVTTPALITASSPMVTFAITAFDSHTGSSNLNGIYKARLKVNGEELESFEMDNISYNDTRYLNAHIDYRYRTQSRLYLQHLSELPGYLNSIYSGNIKHGVADISDRDVYDVQIEVEDTEGNISALKTRIQFGQYKPADVSRKDKMFFPLMLDGYETENCEFYIGELALYDSARIRYSNSATADMDVISDEHHIGDDYIPLHDHFLIRIRPDLSFSESDRDFTVMQWSSGGRSAVQKVQWQNEWANGRFRDFGTFRLVRDTVPPSIVPIGFKDGSDLSKARQIVFSVKDNLPGVKNVRAELNGRWLRFTNDKSKNFIYQFDEKCPTGTHLLQISAEDEAGNRTVQLYNFVR